MSGHCEIPSWQPLKDRTRLLCDFASILVGGLITGDLAMPEYELAELISTISSNLLTNITVILTVMSFYIVAAYAVGAELTLT